MQSSAPPDNVDVAISSLGNTGDQDNARAGEESDEEWETAKLPSEETNLLD